MSVYGGAWLFFATEGRGLLLAEGLVEVIFVDGDGRHVDKRSGDRSLAQML